MSSDECILDLDECLGPMFVICEYEVDSYTSLYFLYDLDFFELSLPTFCES